MGLIERRTGKPFISVQAKASESEDEIYVGPNWIRSGQNVDVPMADKTAQRKVKARRVPPVVHGEDILLWSFAFVFVAVLIAIWIFR